MASYESGGDSASIRVEVEKRLQVGSALESLDLNQIYLLYCEYARCSGFRVRKGRQRCFPDSIDMMMMVYYCSCEGHSESKCNVERLSHFNEHMMRTNCKARLRVDREWEGPWTVSVFDKYHNHELLPQDPRSLLRLAPHLSYVKIVVQESGGGTRKQTKVDVGDAISCNIPNSF